MPDPLLQFENPPVDEAILGIQFDPLPRFHAAHLGLFWTRIRSRYPLTEEQPSLLPQVEPPEFAPGQPGLSLQAMPFVPRCWFLTANKTELIQLQRDRFLRNWRQLTGTATYPGFGHLLQEFRREWQGFLSFVREEDLGTVSVNQCELTYIDHIAKGAGWEEFADLPEVFTILKNPGLPSSSLSPELLSWEARYKLGEGRGRLHVTMTPAFRARDFKFVLSIAFTARGAPAGSSPEQVFGWFDLAHQQTLSIFTELTQPRMHELWKKSHEK